jgi:hypothetical protein
LPASDPVAAASGFRLMLTAAWITFLRIEVTS